MPDIESQPASIRGSDEVRAVNAPDSVPPNVTQHACVTARWGPTETHPQPHTGWGPMPDTHPTAVLSHRDRITSTHPAAAIGDGEWERKMRTPSSEAKRTDMMIGPTGRTRNQREIVTMMTISLGLPLSEIASEPLRRLPLYVGCPRHAVTPRARTPPPSRGLRRAVPPP